jgi:endonuclease/exonuclease/phosphatase family metal-dependent hydrolase
LSDNADAQNWLVDDAGNSGGLDQDAIFVVMGDLNADPVEGSGRREAIQKLLGHERVNDTQPKASRTDAAERASRYRGPSDIRTKTADFGRNGLMRVDFVIPSRRLRVVDSGVFWPASNDPKSRWANATDHRLVWIEVQR